MGRKAVSKKKMREKEVAASSFFFSFFHGGTLQYILFVLAFVSVRGPLPCFLFPPPPPFSVETTKKRPIEEAPFLWARAVCVCVPSPLCYLRRVPPPSRPRAKKRSRACQFSTTTSTKGNSRVSVFVGETTDRATFMWVIGKEGGRKKRSNLFISLHCTRI